MAVGVSGVSGLPFTLISHVLAVAATTMVLVWCLHFRGGFAWESSTNKILIFNLHPFLMLTGMVIIGGEAILSYKALPLKKDQKKLIHMVLHLIALILGIIGIYSVLKYHHKSGFPNFYSLHSWLGILVISLYGLQWIYGFIVFFYLGGKVSLRNYSLPWHVAFGLIVYALAVGNSALGFLEDLTFLESIGLPKYSSEALLVNFTAVVAILYGASVILIVLGLGRGP